MKKEFLDCIEKKLIQYFGNRIKIIHFSDLNFSFYFREFQIEIWNNNYRELEAYLIINSTRINFFEVMFKLNFTKNIYDGILSEKSSLTWYLENIRGFLEKVLQFENQIFKN